jgi:hypothetical protein
MKVGIQPADRLGDAVWIAWGATGLRHLESPPEIHSPIKNPLNELICPQLINTSPSQNQTYDLSIGFPWDTEVLPYGDRKLKFPLPGFYRSSKIQKIEDAPHYQSTGEKHVLKALEKTFQEEWPDFKLPKLPKLPAYDLYIPDQSNQDIQTITINLGGSRKEKLYPLEKWIEVIKALRQKNFQIICLGADIDQREWERLLATEIRKDSNLPEVINLTGKTTLAELTSLIIQSVVHIASDTGTGHLAAALDRKTISLFGQFSFVEVGRPYSEKNIALEAQSWTPAGIESKDIIASVLHAVGDDSGQQNNRKDVARSMY